MKLEIIDASEVFPYLHLALQKVHSATEIINVAVKVKEYEAEIPFAVSLN